MTGSAPLHATRRRLLQAPVAAVAAGLTASGCDLAGSDEPGGSPSAPTSSDTGQATPTPAPDPDEALVARVRSEVAQTAAVVAAAGEGRTAVAREVAPFRRLHTRHLATLPGDDPATAPALVRGDAAAARRRVHQAETRLQIGLADAAVESESGQLAALLASMSAAVAQQLAARETAA